MLSSTLALLLNTSFLLGQLPTMWKNANITPVHKKGNRNLRENYLQISLTCIVCKIAEKVVRNRVVEFRSDLLLLTRINSRTSAVNPLSSYWLATMTGLKLEIVLNLLTSFF